VQLASGQTVSAQAVVVTPGISWRRLGIPRIEALVGSGVFYGSSGSEAQAMAGRRVFVVGGGNSAGQTALHLARYARQVTLLVRGDSLERSMSEYLTTEIAATQNIAVRLRTEIVEGHGDTSLEALSLYDKQRDTSARLAADALFVLIGCEPRTQWLPPAIQLEDGYIRTGRDVIRAAPDTGAWPLERDPLPLETSMPGVFAAGDARYRSIKRVASAVGDGATAVRLVHEYLAAQSASELALPAGV
jgi:thioredoxin reductase (NADPH)